MTKCPHCGQHMLLKFGVKFPPLKAELIDMVERTTKEHGGISADTLAWVFYPGVSTSVAKQRIKTLITQINSMLISTDTRILPKIVNRDRLYRIVGRTFA